MQEPSKKRAVHSVEARWNWTSIDHTDSISADGKRPYSNRSRNDNDDVEDDLFSTSDFKSVRARLLAWEAAIMLSTPLSGISVIAFQLARDTA